jgi:hypothetical protein
LRFFSREAFSLSDRLGFFNFFSISEILLYCSKTKKPLPFGSLGVHKKNAFKEATVCLFVFDCIYLVSKKIKF